MKPQVTFLFTALLLGASTVSLPAQANNRQTEPLDLAQEQEPVAPERTTMTPQNNNRIAVQITDGEFRFRGVLVRSSGNIFLAHDRQVRVIYDREVGQVVVINVVTGTEFYNYPYRDPQRNTSEGAL